MNIISISRMIIMNLKFNRNNISSNYNVNCFLLFLPILIWNVCLGGQLPQNYQPEVFSKATPSFLIYGENISKFILFAISFLMPLRIRSKKQKIGFYIYIFGLLLYFLSWILLISFPDDWWSTSFIGFSAPAFTPAIWLLGISFIGSSFYLHIPFHRFTFILFSTVFLFFHIAHTVIVFHAIG
ncbi:uncharacterized membrane protein (DUF485 family) [Sphingobacterium sp. 2149]|nr:uncharacterized membrane protein (DUF485 family) [Sphingobacterium sp. 2149]